MCSNLFGGQSCYPVWLPLEARSGDCILNFLSKINQDGNVFTSVCPPAKVTGPISFATVRYPGGRGVGYTHCTIPYPRGTTKAIVLECFFL